MKRWPERLILIGLILIAFLAGTYVLRTCTRNPIFPRGEFFF